MYWVGYILALLAAIAVGWVLPLVGVALMLPLLQLVYTLQPWVAAGLMLCLTGLLVYYSITRQAWWQAVLWGALWGLGALTALAGWFNWYALFIEVILIIILLVPGIVAPAWVSLLRWFAAGEMLLTLVLLWGQGAGLPGVTLVMALLLLALATLLGLGAYRPFEARRIRRRLAGLVTAAAVLLILWQPVVLPAGHWLEQAAGSVGQAVAVSPVGRWYRATAFQWERRELGEAAKTEALRQLQPTLTEAHKARWEKVTQQIPKLPLAPREWEDLGIPRQADP